MTLRIKRISEIDLDRLASADHAAMAELSTLEWHTVGYCPWEERFPYRPEVRFQVAHSERYLYLRYRVSEDFVRAQYIRINENVWEDSCVEFFLSLDGRQTYYNLEFNVLGTGLVGYGSADKSTRKRLDPSLTAQISTFTHVSKVGGQSVWQMLLVVPKTIFGQEIPLNQVVHANFYKCGDGLPQPHYLAWNDIKNPTPNFHLPEYFGEILFEN